MIYPFASQNGILLKDSYYLNLDLVEKINGGFSYKERKEVISLYITEGIPFAFKTNPLIFEDIRNWIGRHLNVETKCISITGSSRLGFSLNPKKWGIPYKNTSDLDFLIVSEEIFDQYKFDFKQYAINVKNRIDNRERISKNDLDNLNSLTNSILNFGFIDQFKIPIDRNYKNIYKAYDLMAHLLQRMKLTGDCPKPYKASIRVYKDWSSCIEHLHRNFRNAFLNKEQ